MNSAFSHELGSGRGTQHIVHNTGRSTKHVTQTFCPGLDTFCAFIILINKSQEMLSNFEVELHQYSGRGYECVSRTW